MASVFWMLHRMFSRLSYKVYLYEIRGYKVSGLREWLTLWDWRCHIFWIWAKYKRPLKTWTMPKVLNIPYMEE